MFIANFVRSFKAFGLDSKLWNLNQRKPYITWRKAELINQMSNAHSMRTIRPIGMLNKANVFARKYPVDPALRSAELRFGSPGARH